MPDVPVYFYDRNGRIITNEREIRRLTKAGLGKWKYNFSLDNRRYKGSCIDPETGKIATTSKEAEGVAEKIRQAVISNTYAEATKNPTFEDFAKNNYLKWALQYKRAKEFYTVYDTPQNSDQ